MINYISILTVSLLMMWAVSVDIREHGNRRSKWWVAVGFLLSLPGAVVYILYDRVRK